ncbi:MAG: glycerol-3-phosphate dehydrogenase/oxidase [Gammaproteobacteria bacterium]
MHRDFSAINGRHFDVLVCGGGIYGAWTAYDATLRGLKVALVEQGDWACATSSASSKLIHGGLRYLELFDFKLVRKALAERQMLLEAAPHRIWPLRFNIPVYRDSRIGRLKLTIGLMLYDWLAGATSERAAFHRFSAGNFAERFPGLNTEGLLAGFTYFDAQTDDARYVLELVDGALKHGGVCINFCKVTGLLKDEGRLTGADVTDQMTGETGAIRASLVVNTTGQWSSRLQSDVSDHRLSKGVHLVLPGIIGDEALLLTAKSDGRVFFMMPWYDSTLVGTTDNDFRGDPDRVAVEASDIDYLLTEVNRVVKGMSWRARDIIGCFAGLRVLKAAGQGRPSAVSRDWELKISDNGLLNSIGGKLTSARADAETIVDRLCSNLGLDRTGFTFAKPLPWRPEGHYDEWASQHSVRASDLGIDRDSARWLLRRHGNRVDEVFHLCEMKPELSQRVLPGLPFILADLVFCARREMVVRLEDLLRRRMPLLILARMSESDLHRLARLAATELNWDEEKLHREYLDCKQRWLDPSIA